MGYMTGSIVMRICLVNNSARMARSNPLWIELLQRLGETWNASCTEIQTGARSSMIPYGFSKRISTSGPYLFDHHEIGHTRSIRRGQKIVYKICAKSLKRRCDPGPLWSLSLEWREPHRIPTISGQTSEEIGRHGSRFRQGGPDAARAFVLALEEAPAQLAGHGTKGRTFC